jgi:hypothetical protein
MKGKEKMSKETLTRTALAVSLYKGCENLFADYPLAVEPVTAGRTQARMALVLESGTGTTSWTLHWVKDGQPSAFFTVRPWRDRDQGVVIGSGGRTGQQGALSFEEAARVVITSVPFPRNGSMFGWKDGDTVTALILFYSDPETDEEPVRSCMPLAGTPESQWPPFLGERLFGSWFWEYCRTGRIVDLGSLAGQTQRMVFWVPLEIPSAGPGCVAVKADLAAGDGTFTLPRGCYAWWKALRGGAPVPPLADLLADPRKIDLGTRFPLR